jgi:hypothetical protein
VHEQRIGLSQDGGFLVDVTYVHPFPLTRRTDPEKHTRRKVWLDGIERSLRSASRSGIISLTTGSVRVMYAMEDVDLEGFLAEKSTSMAVSNTNRCIIDHNPLTNHYKLIISTVYPGVCNFVLYHTANALRPILICLCCLLRYLVEKGIIE